MTVKQGQREWCALVLTVTARLPLFLTLQICPNVSHPFVLTSRWHALVVNNGQRNNGWKKWREKDYNDHLYPKGLCGLLSSVPRVTTSHGPMPASV
jgi:hypothetical protein